MNGAKEATKTHPEPVAAILALFEGPLAELQFPDLDGPALSSAAREVERLQAQLQGTLEAVQVARLALEEGQKTLAGQAHRAHAYASVYAQDKPELAAELAAIKMTARPLAPKKRRGRPPKSSKRPSGASADTLAAGAAGAGGAAEADKTQTSLSVAEDAA